MGRGIRKIIHSDGFYQAPIILIAFRAVSIRPADIEDRLGSQRLGPSGRPLDCQPSPNHRINFIKPN